MLIKNWLPYDRVFLSMATQYTHICKVVLLFAQLIKTTAYTNYQRFRIVQYYNDINTNDHERNDKDLFC